MQLGSVGIKLGSMFHAFIHQIFASQAAAPPGTDLNWQSLFRDVGILAPATDQFSWVGNARWFTSLYPLAYFHSSLAYHTEHQNAGHVSLFAIFLLSPYYSQLHSGHINNYIAY